MISFNSSQNTIIYNTKKSKYYLIGNENTGKNSLYWKKSWITHMENNRYQLKSFHWIVIILAISTFCFSIHWRYLFIWSKYACVYVHLFSFCLLLVWIFCCWMINHSVCYHISTFSCEYPIIFSLILSVSQQRSYILILRLSSSKQKKTETKTYFLYIHIFTITLSNSQLNKYGSVFFSLQFQTNIIIEYLYCQSESENQAITTANMCCPCNSYQCFFY